MDLGKVGHLVGPVDIFLKNILPSYLQEDSILLYESQSASVPPVHTVWDGDIWDGYGELREAMLQDVGILVLRSPSGDLPFMIGPMPEDSNRVEWKYLSQT